MQPWTGQTDLTFKLDFPGNLCKAAFTILAMFWTWNYFLVFLSTCHNAPHRWRLLWGWGEGFKAGWLSRKLLQKSTQASQKLNDWSSSELIENEIDYINDLVDSSGYPMTKVTKRKALWPIPVKTKPTWPLTTIPAAHLQGITAVFLPMRLLHGCLSMWSQVINTFSSPQKQKPNISNIALCVN